MIDPVELFNHPEFKLLPFMEIYGRGAAFLVLEEEEEETLCFSLVDRQVLLLPITEMKAEFILTEWTAALLPELLKRGVSIKKFGSYYSFTNGQLCLNVRGLSEGVLLTYYRLLKQGAPQTPTNTGD